MRKGKSYQTKAPLGRRTPEGDQPTVAVVIGAELRQPQCPTADVFDNKVTSAWREDLFALIGECDGLDWLLLTKRPQNILKMLPSDWGDGYPNVWLGVTAEDQVHFDRRWKYVQKIRASLKCIASLSICINSRTWRGMAQQ